MKHVLRGAAALVFLVALTARAATPDAPADDPRVRELVDKADRVLRGETSAAVVEMRIKTADYDRSYSMVMWDDARGTEKTLVKILGPALWRGNGTLKVGERLLTYDPRNDHVTVVGSSMLGDSWMGSHFTNDDLVKETRLADDYRASLAADADAPAPDGGAPVRAVRLVLRPNPRAPVVWGRLEIELWTRGDTVVPTKMTYFRDDLADARPSRTLTFTDVRELGGRLVPARMHMEVADKPGEFTEIVYQKLRFDVDIPAEKFTERALRL